MNREQIRKKVLSIAGEILKEKGYISFVDIFLKMGYLDPKEYEEWRRKKIPYLEKAININLSKINHIMKVVRDNCLNGKLKQNYTEYKSWGKGTKIALQFSKSGEANIEKLYSTHFLKP